MPSINTTLESNLTDNETNEGRLNIPVTPEFKKLPNNKQN